MIQPEKVARLALAATITGEREAAIRALKNLCARSEIDSLRLPPEDIEKLKTLTGYWDGSGGEVDENRKYLVFLDANLTFSTNEEKDLNHFISQNIGWHNVSEGQDVNRPYAPALLRNAFTKSGVWAIFEMYG